MHASITFIAVPDDRAGCVRPLFEADGLATWNASIGATLAGTCPGRAWADDLDQPRAAFLITPEGAFLAGDPDLPAFHEALHEFITGTVFDPNGFNFLRLFMTLPDRWLPAWEAIFPAPAVAIARQHYRCTRLAFEWRAAVPDGYSVTPITAALLDAPDVIWPDHVHDWIANNWCKRAHFLAHGFGVVTLDEQPGARRVASWSLADAVSDGYGEIGIQTLPDYRRRGLATITAAAAVEYALAHGWHTVGWHCNADNPGSSRTALAVGFHHERDYTQYLATRGPYLE